MQSSTSFSASRQGRPRPANLFPGSRSASDERPWPSPSFNSSMSLAKVDDVFADGSRSTCMRRSFSNLPPTPITAGLMSSQGFHGQKLPSLTDLFVNDEGILGPMTPLLTPRMAELSPRDRDAMSEDLRPVSSPSDSRGLQRFHEVPVAPACSLTLRSAGDDATPLDTEDHSSPVVGSLPRDGDVIGLGIDLETTPKASEKAQRGRFPPQYPEQEAGPSLSSPPRACPGAPRIGIIQAGLFGEDLNWSPPSHRSVQSGAKPTDLSKRDDRRRSAELRSISMEREAVVELDHGMPRENGVSGLGITFDAEPHASTSSSDHASSVYQLMDTAASSPKTTSGSTASAAAVSPPSRTSPAARARTGLTPLVRSTRINSADSPTRPSSRRESLGARIDSQTILPVAQLKSSKASSSKATMSTPIKSRPIFRLDNGSSSKKKVQGHKMNSNESPWGVFGVKDEWRPLAAPNISRSGGNGARKLSSEGMQDSPRTALATRGKENIAPDAAAAAAASTILAAAPSTPGKRSSQSVEANWSPSKKQRSAGERPKTGTGTPMKENLPGVGVFRVGSPQKRMRAASTVGLSSPQKQPVGLR